MSVDKIVPVQLTALPTYECGAVALAFLVHPETDAAAQRAEVQHALCFTTLVAWANEDPGWATTPQQVKPIYLTQDQKAVEAALKTFDRRLRDRLIAARMAIAFLKQADVNGPIALPKGVKQLSIKEMAQLVMGDAGASEVGNVETRIWKPSLPVIHLAAALAVLMDTAEKAGVPKLRVDQILRSRAFIESVIQTAQHYETLIEQSDKLARHAAPLWRFRVT